MSPSDALKMNLEVHIIPVTDIDRAKAFYDRLGWRLDDDVAPMAGIRFIQFTPPGCGQQQPPPAGILLFVLVARGWRGV